MNPSTKCVAIAAAATFAFSGLANAQCGSSKDKSAARTMPAAMAGISQCAGSKAEESARMMPVAMTAAGQGDIVETAVANGNFKTLAAALNAAGLVDTLQSDGPFTVFAPTDAAFAKLPRGTVESLLRPENKHQLVDILTYHVVSGAVPARKVARLSDAITVNGQRVDITLADGKVKVDNATVTATDIRCSNGIIHVIDTVILPSSNNIVETAQSAGSFGTLLAAAQAAGLVDLLQSEGPFTVFAPTDEAFAKLPAGTVETLLKPENRQQLADILKYHVVAGRVYSDDAVTAGSAVTAEGEAVRVSIRNGRLMINDASVISSDLDTKNGVIHVIDTVLIPG